MNTVMISYLYMVCAADLAEVKATLSKQEQDSDSDAD